MDCTNRLEHERIDRCEIEIIDVKTSECLSNRRSEGKLFAQQSEDFRCLGLDFSKDIKQLVRYWTVATIERGAK